MNWEEEDAEKLMPSFSKELEITVLIQPVLRSLELSAQDILMHKDTDSHIQRNTQIYPDTPTPTPTAPQSFGTCN